MSTPLERLARKAEDRPFFLAWALAEFCRARDLDDARLADLLGCPVTVLPQLRLCRTPAEDPPGFRRDLAEIGAAFGIHVPALAEAVKLARALVAMRGGTGGRLLAARDAEPPAEEPPGGES
jgi:hypothetical protein